MEHVARQHDGDFARVFIVEPGLTHYAGHPLECVLSLQIAAQSLGVTPHVVSPHYAPPDILAGIRFVHPVLTASCFPISPDGPQAFAAALLHLAESHAIDRHDLILVTSCHANELGGVRQFLNAHTFAHGSLPAVALSFHQLYPPADDADTVVDPEYQAVWVQRLRTAFALLHDDRRVVSYWTSPCDGLAAAYRAVARRHVGVLPFPITLHTAEGTTLRKRGSDPVTFAFLGDGRQERGLIPLLQALLQTDQSPDRRFVLQFVNSRGYGEAQRAWLYVLLERVRGRADVELIERELTPAEFHAVLEATDVVVLPYDPRHYGNRASMVFVIAAMHAVPVVASDGTWMAEEMRAGHADGIIWPYDPSDTNRTTSALRDALLRMHSQWSKHHVRARERAHKYRHQHVPERYLRTILDHHRRLQFGT